MSAPTVISGTARVEKAAPWNTRAMTTPETASRETPAPTAIRPTTAAKNDPQPDTLGQCVQPPVRNTPRCHPQQKAAHAALRQSTLSVNVLESCSRPFSKSPVEMYSRSPQALLKGTLMVRRALKLLLVAPRIVEAGRSAGYSLAGC